jgi:hypothetical protein
MVSVRVMVWPRVAVLGSPDKETLRSQPASLAAAQVVAALAGGAASSDTARRAMSEVCTSFT